MHSLYLILIALGFTTGVLLGLQNDAQLIQESVVEESEQIELEPEVPFENETTTSKLNLFK